MQRLSIFLFVWIISHNLTGRCLTSKKAVPIYNFLAITYKDKPIKKWHCDNGREFKNKVFDQFRQFAFPSSKAAHGAPRTPTTQGMVEGEKIGKTQTISSYLELAMEVYNNRTHRAIGMSPHQAIGIKPLFQTATLDTGFQVNLDENVVYIPEISYKLRQEIILKNIEKYNNNWSSKSKKQFQIDDIVIQFLEDGVNNKQKTGMIWEYYVGPNKLVHCNQARERTNDFQLQYNDSNDLNDLTSFTSNLYLSNHSKVVYLLLSFTKTKKKVKIFKKGTISQ
ncbi:hypothetical protein ACTFIY_004858 [Dictyostelium cf. discoideum]